jgi:hypothetical protein
VRAGVETIHILIPLQDVRGIQVMRAIWKLLTEYSAFRSMI